MSGLVGIDIDAEIQKLNRQLAAFPREARSILRNSINATSRKVRKQIVLDVEGRYAISKPHILKDVSEGAPKITNARESNMTAYIRSKGPMREIMDFMTRPNTETGAAAAKVLSNSPMKSLQKGDLKAFVAQFRSGHIAIVQREGPKRLPVKKLLSPAVPHMLRNEEIRMQAEEMAHRTLQTEIAKRVAKLNIARGA